MDLATIEMDRYEANEHMKRLRGSDLTPDQKAMRRALVHMRQGRKVLHWAQVVSRAGSDAMGRPKVAIAPLALEGKRVWCKVDQQNVLPGQTDHRYSVALYTKHGAWRETPIVTHVHRQETPVARGLVWSSTLVPEMPPDVRAESRRWSKSRLFILTEADWKAAPVDPALLLRVSRQMFAVLATWDLTPLERLALGMGT